ncbi:C4-type zinc ribbon domain-containing protein [uncultured Desulfovibrio sp.]|uniref:zinc ribbon domain-containing protein n=1 Tax=uncultured Desulfovibrio sp. TaxID=167968 RepID=UPI002627CC82|nr:C4-type zinc ribbon domain-containing protein [uncultured Desulfovibrio sp.]
MSTAVYLDQIRQLVELQKIDDAIFAVRQELERAPRELEDLQQRFDASNAQRERVLEKLNHLQDQQKRLDFEIEDDSARIKKSKNKLMQVENQREHHAMMREMDSIEKVIRSREEEKMALMEELQLQNEKLAQIDLTHTGLQAELEVRRDSLEEKLTACRARMAELESKREVASSAIPHPVFVRYEFIRKRLEHPVIVAVKDGICTGCHIAVPPQSYIELQRGQQILSCPNCQRLIFWNEHFDFPVTPGIPETPKTLVD